MYKAIFLILFSIIFVQELEVDGDLKVTGSIQNESLDQIIANLQSQITSLQTQILDLQMESGIADCNGVIGGNAIIDFCGVCNGDNSSCPGVYDADGNLYTILSIGNQFWLKENLQTTTRNDGSNLNTVAGTSSEINSAWEDAIYANLNMYLENGEYGNIYNIYSVIDEDICPEGWHVPTDYEWGQLELFLGLPPGELEATGNRGTNEGGKLKALDSWDFWDGQVTSETTNESGFTALAAGIMLSSIYNHGNMTTFWGSGTDTENIFLRGLDYSNSKINRSHAGNPHYGYHVRCIAD